jgi:ankyrin repeat protein
MKTGTVHSDTNFATRKLVSECTVPVFVLLFAVPLLAASAELATAIQSGQRAAAIEMIAKKSADLNAAEADGTTPLIWAANLNDTDLALRLLKAGANPNVRNQFGSTPLGEAALNANTELMKTLLDAGADPNAAGADGQTPLMLVSRTANVAGARLLLDKGCEGERERGPARANRADVGGCVEPGSDDARAARPRRGSGCEVRYRSHDANG